jgi:hypothetical protein
VLTLNYISFDQIRNHSLLQRVVTTDNNIAEPVNSNGGSNNINADAGWEEVVVPIMRIRLRKPMITSNLLQHPTCIGIHPIQPLEYILVGTRDCGLYLIESKTKIQMPRNQINQNVSKKDLGRE